jgi:hypothetical protein
MDRDTSPAFQALTETARHVLELIEGELARCGGDTVAIRLVDFVNLGVAPSSIGFSLRQVTLLGFVGVERGPPPAHISTFWLSTRWQSIDATDAARLKAAAHTVSAENALGRAVMETPRAPITRA